MLSLLMFIYVLIMTLFRIVDLFLVFSLDEIALPMVLIVLVGILTLCGVYIIIRKIFGKLRLRELMVYFILSLVIIGFNIAFIAFRVPIKLSVSESILVGSILDLLLSLIFLYYAGKNISSRYTVSHDNSDSAKEDKND